MTFQLDTSGRVRATPNSPHAANWYCWSDLTSFAQGYVEAMLTPCEALHYSLTDRFAAFSDLAPATVERIIADCARFATLPGRSGLHDRPCAGAIFWERRQANIDSYFPVAVLSLSDDGLIMLREVGQ